MNMNKPDGFAEENVTASIVDVEQLSPPDRLENRKTGIPRKESYPNSTKKRTMEQDKWGIDDIIVPPTKLRRQVASCWKLDQRQSIPADPAAGTSWRDTTLLPPASGSYLYEKQYKKKKKKKHDQAKGRTKAAERLSLIEEDERSLFWDPVPEQDPVGDMTKIFTKTHRRLPHFRSEGDLLKPKVAHRYLATIMQTCRTKDSVRVATGTWMEHGIPATDIAKVSPPHRVLMHGLSTLSL